MSTICCACLARSADFRSNGFSIAEGSLNNDGTGHLRMNGTKIGKGSGFIEGERKGFVGVEHARFENAVGADHCVRNIVTILPGDYGSGGNCDGLRAKTEIIDFHFRGV